MKGLFEQILLAKVYDVAIESQLQHAPKLSKKLNNNIYLKREDSQPVHSFKIRGAYNKIANLSNTDKAKGVITASAGNHAQGVAMAAQRHSLSALIVMPKTTPEIKVEAVKDYGAKVILEGDSYSDAYNHCQKLVKTTGRTFIHPFDDVEVIAGQGTIGREIMEQLPGVTHVFVPVGGGGLLSGVAAYIKQLKPSVKVIGVEPEDSDAMLQSLNSDKRITLQHVGIFADGVAVKQVGSLTFELVKKYVDKVMTVSTDEVCAAIKDAFEQTRTIMEPAGALGLAGATRYCQEHKLTQKNIVCICSGANMTFERLQFVAERTLTGSGREALFAVELSEEPGSLRRFCQDVVNGYSISEFSYRLHQRGKAVIFVGINVTQEHKQKFINKMQAQGYRGTDLSSDDLAKEHIRHMIGGHSNTVKNERLYTVDFPERPGALNDFLSAIRDMWNISLFHYRGLGGDVGRVLIGFEATNRAKLEQMLNKTGYYYQRAESTASRIFVG